MSDHQALFSVHENTKHVHTHVALVRVAPESNSQGKYYIPVDTGIVVSKSPENGKIRRNDALCMQATVSEICNRRGWEIPENCRTSPDGKPRHTAGTTDRMSDGTRGGEARTGLKAEERQIAEYANRVFNTSKTASEAVSRLNAAGLAYRVSYKNGAPVGAIIESHDGIRVKNSRLSRENSFRQLTERFPGLASIKNSAVATPSVDIYRDQMTANAAKKLLKSILLDAKANGDSWDTLAAKLPSGMNLERSGGGYVIKYNGGADYLKLSQIIRSFSLNKKSEGENTPNASTLAKSQSKVNRQNAWASATAAQAAKIATAATSAAADITTAETLAEVLDEADAAIQAAYALRKANSRAALAEAAAIAAQEKLDRINNFTKDSDMLNQNGPVFPKAETHKSEHLDASGAIKKILETPVIEFDFDEKDAIKKILETPVIEFDENPAPVEVDPLDAKLARYKARAAAVEGGSGVSPSSSDDTGHGPGQTQAQTHGQRMQ